jgi:hypothetical protein
MLLKKPCAVALLLLLRSSNPVPPASISSSQLEGTIEVVMAL